MKPSTLPRQALRTTHTPAICDSGRQTPETRAITRSAGSTAPIEAVHIRGPLASPLSVCAALDAGSPQ
jgi:hypothetical protein